MRGSCLKSLGHKITLPAPCNPPTSPFSLRRKSCEKGFRTLELRDWSFPCFNNLMIGLPINGHFLWKKKLSVSFLSCINGSLPRLRYCRTLYKTRHKQQVGADASIGNDGDSADVGQRTRWRRRHEIWASIELGRQRRPHCAENWQNPVNLRNMYASSQRVATRVATGKRGSKVSPHE